MTSGFDTAVKENKKRYRNIDDRRGDDREMEIVCFYSSVISASTEIIYKQDKTTHAVKNFD